MLLSNFYQVNRVSSIGTQWNVSLQLMAEHPLYKGHFPEQPVVPGVCIMQMIKECVSDILGRELQYQYVSSCKFLLAIDPTKHESLDFLFGVSELEDGNTQLQAEGLCQGMIFVKLKAILLNK